MQHEPNARTIINWGKDKPYDGIKSLTAQAGYSVPHPVKTDNWRYNAKLGGGALYDMGVYTINGARYASGIDPIAVLETKQSTTHPKVFDEVDETTEFKLAFSNGVIANCATSVGINMNELTVKCDKESYGLSPFQDYNSIQGKSSNNKRSQQNLSNQQAKQIGEDTLAIMIKKPKWYLKKCSYGYSDCAGGSRIG